MEQLFSIKPDATAKDLEESIKSNANNIEVCKQVAKHPNTSPKTLKELFGLVPVEVLNNPIIDLLILENPNFLTDLCKSCPDCFQDVPLPLFFLEWAINHADSWLLCSIAIATKTPVSILEKLASYDDREVRYQVARNPNISENIIEKLAKDSDLDVLRGLTENQKTPSHVLENLASNKHSYVRCFIARNPNISEDVIEKLAKDSDLEVLRGLAENQKTPHHVLENLAFNKHSYIRSVVAINPNISEEMIEKLAKDREIKVLRGLAENQKTPHHILENLSQHQDNSIRQAVASNQNISLSIMKQFLRDKSNSVKAALARNKKMTFIFLNELAKNAINNQDTNEILPILLSIRLNPNITLELEERLSQICIKTFQKLNSSQPFTLDFNEIREFTDLEMKRVSWTKEIGRNYLLKTYGKKSRLHLTDRELIEFCQHIINLPTSEKIKKST
ncbi:hypothetical protein H1P_1050006 [Hyella patelloides LEGE 07179]|uniref:Leucine rich repeat variant n=1 Tax=Hyella patelloides LEGE 07179 TaxID=945734 RepID=A0A563VJG5_9CYAN|nr:hypothetical protein [Hyella patelloides]VEP11455.1 hypothetical protein H1P_1050006 [Hyella patelloides LEGE 07179]